MPRGDATPPRRVVPIAPPKKGIIPSNRDFELYRLEREIEHVKSQAKQYLDAIRYKDATLVRWKHLAELGLQFGAWPSLGEFLRLVDKTRIAISHEGRMNADIDTPSRAKR